jgi:hypothetical protein
MAGIGSTNNAWKGTIPQDSFRPILLELRYHGEGQDGPETTYATGTAFFLKVEETDFLVTARHNLTGWDKVNGKPLSTRGVSPTHIGIGFWPSPPPGGYPLADGINIQLFELPLYEDQLADDGQPVPRWLEHPVMGSTMDVAAMAVKIPTGFDVLYLPWESGASNMVYSDSKLWVTQQTSIVGYPYGLNNNNLPVWVTGTIASEPEFLYRSTDDEQLPIFLVDARTREGQSGSPVLLFRHPGQVITRNGKPGLARGTQSQLLGVYTGRIRRDSDLGVVWRIGTVEEVCRADVRSRFNPVRSSQ